jgi:hypothetical protein
MFKSALALLALILLSGCIVLPRGHHRDQGYYRSPPPGYGYGGGGYGGGYQRY